jgi:O-antigen ligase
LAAHRITAPAAALADRAQAPPGGRALSGTYVRWAAIVTFFLYTAGYAGVGFGLLFFGALWGLLRWHRFPWQPSAVDVPLAAFAVVLLASALVSPFRTLSLGITLMLLISGAVYFGSFAWLLGRDLDARAMLLRAWAAGAVPAAVIAIADALMTHARAEIPGGVGPNGLGTTLALAGILQLGLALRARSRERALWLACGLLGLAGLLASESRGSLVGWAVGAAYLTWRELRAEPRRMAAAACGGAVVLALAFVLAPPLADRARSVLSDVSQNRIRIWHASLGMVAARPLLGTGFGTFGQAYARVKAPGMSPEPFAFDLALNLAVETGILGFLAALWVAIAAARAWAEQGRRAPPPEGGRAAPPGVDPFRHVLSAMWIALLVDQLADNTLFSVGTSAALWLLVALIVLPAVSPTEEGPREQQARA